MRTCSALLSVALAAALAGCGSAPTKPAFAPGYTPTEAEMGLAEQNSATELPSSTAAELKSEGVLPYYTDTRLLYLAAIQRQGALNLDDHHHVDIGKYLDRANLAAHLFGVGKFALDPPLISLLSIGTSTTSRRDYGPQYARNILRLPSLTLVGTLSAGGAQPGTPAYGARLDSLFTQADTLVRAVSLNCRPEAASLAQIRKDELRMPWNDYSNRWFKDMLHQRAYACTRRVAKHDREQRLGSYKIATTAFPVHKHDKSVEREFGYSGITGTIAQAGDPFVTVTFSWLDEYPHLGCNDAAWTLLKELKADLPEGWYYILSAAPPGETGGALAIYAGRKQKGELTMTRLSDAPK